MCDDLDVQLGRRLRRRRQLLGMTQFELGVLCGVRFQQIQKYESASNKMSAGMIGRLASALGVEVGYFFEGLEALLAPGTSPARRRPKARAGSGPARSSALGSRFDLGHGGGRAAGLRLAPSRDRDDPTCLSISPSTAPPAA